MANVEDKVVPKDGQGEGKAPCAKACACGCQRPHAVLVGGLLIEDGEGNSGDNDFNVAAFLVQVLDGGILVED